MAPSPNAVSDPDRGFTLIELLVVVIIIGILAGIAIPVFLSQRKKGVDATLESDLRSAATAADTYTTDSPSSMVGFTMSDLTGEGFKKHPDNLVSITGSPATGYCVTAYNPSASKAISAATAMTFDSTAGGLNRTGGACPAPPT